jgi:hypothetical protein
MYSMVIQGWRMRLFWAFLGFWRLFEACLGKNFLGVVGVSVFILKLRLGWLG